MSTDPTYFWSFLLVFVRCSALLLASPIFGGPSIPVNIRVFTTLAISAALSTVVKPTGTPIPPDLASLALAVGYEVLMGLMIGLFVSLAFSAFAMAGALIDLQIGLGASQLMNPVTGIPSTILSQYKSMLGLVTFVAIDGHHMIVQSFVESYRVTLSFSNGSADFLRPVIELFTSTSLLAVQLAAPVMAVSIVVDTALGLVNKAVPNMPVLMVGMPAKIALGLIALGVALPAVVSGVDVAVETAMRAAADATRVR